jgi:tRNA-dihydrouridine synthase
MESAMNFGFWRKLKKPFLIIAPMSDVTDVAFREMFARHGAPNVFWTEFVSCDGLCSEGKDRLLSHFLYTKRQRPIVAQLFGATPEHFYRASLLVKELGFDGIDINMGCPDRAVERQGAGAALINNPRLAQKIIFEAKRGAGRLPVSVKTRLGYHKDTMEEWLPYLFETEPAAITLHARTRKELSKVPARWNRIADAVALRDGYFSGTRSKPFILGNGDVTSVADGYMKMKESGADGVMVGRGIFGNPWFFNPRGRRVSVETRLKALLEHTILFEKYFGNSNHDRSTAIRNFDIMKKHFKAYASGFDGAKDIRMKLMTMKCADDMRAFLKKKRYL